MQRFFYFWISKKLGMAVQIVGAYPSRAEKVRTVEINGYEVKVVGVEDLIIDRLVAAKFRRSNAELDTSQATSLLYSFADSLDFAYLVQRAREERVEDVLSALRKKAAKSL
jgi:predicted nucleotidyltransferase